MISSRKRTERAFTMLELLVVVAMIGGIMATVYSVLFGTLEGQRKIDFKVQGSRIGPMILDQIERDLRRFYSANLDHNKTFVGKSQAVQGKQADKFHFVAYTPSTTRIETKRKPVFSAINEVGYVVTETPGKEDFLTIWRREDFFVDEEPLEDGYGVPLYRRVTGFNVKYYDKRGKDAKEEDKWDSESDETSTLPAAIEITLEYEFEPRDQSQTFSEEELHFRKFTARRFITFTEDYASAMAVRSAVPTAPEESSNGAPGGKGGGGGDSPAGGGTPGGGPSMGLGGGGGGKGGSGR